MPVNGDRNTLDRLVLRSDYRRVAVGSEGGTLADRLMRGDFETKREKSLSLGSILPLMAT